MERREYDEKMDALVSEYAAECKKIYDERTAGDYTFEGVISEFLRKTRQIDDLFED